jgi:hypothetical protein
MNLDYLAYFIIYLFIAFVVLPCAAPDRSGYKNGLVVSFSIQLVLVVLGVIMAAMIWAVGRIF